MTRYVYRYEVPIDDQDHEILLCGNPLAVSAHAVNPFLLEFWAEYRPETERAVKFRVFGTGHPVPGDYTWQGTADRTASGLVWHLYARQ